MAKNEETFSSIKSRFIESVDVDSTRILRAQKIVFFCGGKIDSANVAQTRPRSLRSYFHHKLDNDPTMSDIRFVRAEELSQWYFDALRKGIQFPDLLIFETQMSYLSALTCLILESAGAIAELGSFSVLEEFQGHLMIVLRHNEYEQNSFISLGPIRKLENEYGEDGAIFVYDWSVENSINDEGEVATTLDPDELDEVYNQFRGDLQNTLEKSYKSEKFDPENMRHIFLLITDVVAIFHCLKIREINDIINTFNSDIAQNAIKNCLFIASKLGLIKQRRYGGTDYFVSKASKEFAEYNFSGPENKFERVPFKMNVFQTIDKHEAQRKKVLELSDEAADEDAA